MADPTGDAPGSIPFVLTSVLHRSVVLRRSGLVFARRMSFPEWETIGQRLTAVADSSTWWVADWLAYGEVTFHDRYREAIQLTTLNYQTLRNYAWVARRFELSRRRDSLSFGHHAEVAALERPEQDYWLRKADELGWSRNHLRNEVRASIRERHAADALAGADDSFREAECAVQKKAPAHRHANAGHICLRVTPAEAAQLAAAARSHDMAVEEWAIKILTMVAESSPGRAHPAIAGPRDSAPVDETAAQKVNGFSVTRPRWRLGRRQQVTLGAQAPSLASRMPRTAIWLRSRLRARRFVGAQLFVWQAGETVADAGVGIAAPGVPMTATTPNYWFCCTKPLTAIAVAQLVQNEVLALDDRVRDLIPAFGYGGKDGVSVRHLLTHTGGLRQLRRPRPFLASDREIVDAVCASVIRDDWQPGLRAGYTPFASWYILGELVRRATGEPISAYVRRHIFQPLGLDRCWLGMSLEEVSAAGPGLCVPYAITDGRAPMPIRFLVSPATLQLVNPASGAIGPISGIGRIFQALLNPDPVAPLICPAVISMFITPQRVGLLDETYQVQWDWGLGFAVDTGRLCAGASGDGFGHPGGSTLVLADRTANRVVAVAVNGLTAWTGAPEVGHASAASQLVEQIYLDLEAA